MVELLDGWMTGCYLSNIFGKTKTPPVMDLNLKQIYIWLNDFIHMFLWQNEYLLIILGVLYVADDNGFKYTYTTK